MKKTICIFATIVPLLVLFSACGAQSTDNGLSPNQKHVQEETSQEADNNRVDPQNDRPGTVSKDSVLDSIVNKAKIEDGILKADNQIDLETWFVSEEAKNISESRVIALEDGTVFGYFVFDGSEYVYDRVLKVLTEKAASMEFDLYTDYNNYYKYLYFIISKTESLNKYIGSMSSARMGNLTMSQ